MLVPDFQSNPLPVAFIKHSVIPIAPVIASLLDLNDPVCEICRDALAAFGALSQLCVIVSLPYPQYMFCIDVILALPASTTARNNLFAVGIDLWLMSKMGTMIPNSGSPCWKPQDDRMSVRTGAHIRSVFEGITGRSPFSSDCINSPAYPLVRHQ